MTTHSRQDWVHHRIGNFMPVSQQQPSFLQIYFVGDDNSVRDIHYGYFPSVKPELVGEKVKVQMLLHKYKYIRDFNAATESVPNNQKKFKVVINADTKSSEDTTSIPKQTMVRGGRIDCDPHF